MPWLRLKAEMEARMLELRRSQLTPSWSCGGVSELPMHGVEDAEYRTAFPLGGKESDEDRARVESWRRQPAVLPWRSVPNRSTRCAKQEPQVDRALKDLA